MNASNSSTGSSPARGAPDPSRRNAAGNDRQRGDEFARLLRDKAAARGDDREAPRSSDTEQEGCGGNAVLVPLAAPPLMAPLLPALQAAGSAALAVPAAAGSMLAPAHAALEAALNSSAPVSPLALQGADAAGAWQVSVHEPLGVAVEMRVTRPANQHPANGPANWTLTIGSSALDASVLARHAPRLNERLRARALTHAHVRIEAEGDKEAS